MYCPRCGEQQSSGNLRFCNRCGLPLGLVSEVLSHGGSLPQLEELYKKRQYFTRRNGILFSLFWFILFVPFGAAFWGVLDVEELSGISAVFGVFSSLLIFLFSLFFLGKPVAPAPDQVVVEGRQPAEGRQMGGQTADRSALPPQQTRFADEFVPPSAGSWRAPDTGEFAVPGSVTEGTTKLLQVEEEEEDSGRG